jgi:cellobiose phosphorylase
MQFVTRSVHSDRRSQAPYNPYGHFSPDGREYIITDPRTPRPWSNIIANPRMGLAVSQAGSGFTWIDNSQLAVITRWDQELNRDTSGKFLYLRDAESGSCGSLSPAPMWPEFDAFECRHGLGFTAFVTERDGIRATWTLFCHDSETIELWHVTLTNLTDRARRLEMTAYLEWCCGVAPSPRREFHKLFLETQLDAARGAITARNRMWDVPSDTAGHWNTDFPYVSALACTEPIDAAEGDKAAFFGRNRDVSNPVALRERQWIGRFGRHEDPIAALRSAIELAPYETRSVGYGLAIASTQTECEALLDATLDVATIEHALADVRQSWTDRLAAHRIDTPSASLDYLTNDWLRYQAISARIWGRCGYYQQSGAYGFRDQLQDSQVWLTIDPAQCRRQISLHAAHQFADGSVYHWWHPTSEQGLITRMTDDLLWLAFVTANYIRETGDYTILDDQTPFLDDERSYPLAEHVRRALTRVFERTSPRGLPYIGAGDWNDGLSAVGLQERGESIWLGHFLHGLLGDWSEIQQHLGNSDDAADLARRRVALNAALNEHGWDGDWYLRATLDDGSKLGSRDNRVGRIFLNAQTWAVLSDVASPERARECMAAVRANLVTKAGALLLAPAYDTPDPAIGYITRYAPGLRENGGVYSHAATWAIAAACKLRDRDLVGLLLDAANPALKNPDEYWAEPYVMPGNVDGPDSPYHGRAGWTWYTGSAAWLHRVICEWVLGVRATWAGLLIDPCMPADWASARMTRPYRGCTYEITIERTPSLPEGGGLLVTMDGEPLEGGIIAPPKSQGARHAVHVRFPGPGSARVGEGEQEACSPSPQPRVEQPARPH